MMLEVLAIFTRAYCAPVRDEGSSRQRGSHSTIRQYALASILCGAFSPIARAAAVQVAGTPERDEVEFKIALSLDDGVPLPRFVRRIQDALVKANQQLAFSFPGLLGRAGYRLDRRFQSFVFKDIYFDSPSLDILKAQSAYRLRYRWSRSELYYRHLLLPFVRAFYPTRAEVQFKTGYQPLLGGQGLKVRESRFEFRNEAEPFRVAGDAPRPPWPEQQFIPYAASGVFGPYKMLPYARMEQVVGPKPKLDPVLTLVTTRQRSHLSVSQNPWGAGPNPDQVFILTVDSVLVGDRIGARGDGAFDRFVEIEIEIDRNTSVEIEALLAGRNSNELEVKAAAQMSHKAQEALSSDLRKLSDFLVAHLSAEPGITRLALRHKYERAMGPNRHVSHEP